MPIMPCYTALGSQEMKKSLRYIRMNKYLQKRFCLKNFEYLWSIIDFIPTTLMRRVLYFFNKFFLNRFRSLFENVLDLREIVARI